MYLATHSVLNQTVLSTCVVVGVADTHIFNSCLAVSLQVAYPIAKRSSNCGEHHGGARSVHRVALGGEKVLLREETHQPTPRKIRDVMLLSTTALCYETLHVMLFSITTSKDKSRTDRILYNGLIVLGAAISRSAQEHALADPKLHGRAPPPAYPAYAGLPLAARHSGACWPLDTARLYLARTAACNRKLPSKKGAGWGGKPSVARYT